MEHSKLLLPTVAEFDSKVEILRARLEKWGNEQVETFNDPLLMGVPSGTAGNILGLGNPIPSKRVLDASAITQDVLGFKIPPIIIQKGGYETSQEFVKKITTKLRKVVTGEIKPKEKKVKKMILASVR